MPVAVSGTHLATKSTRMGSTKTVQDSLIPDPAQPLGQARKRRKRKGRELEEVLPSSSTAGPSKAASNGAWLWRSITDSSASRVPPVFTKDGSYFFSVLGSSVKIYSSATGQVVSTLDVPSWDGSSSTQDTSHSDITSIILNPHNPYQLFTGSLDGYIRLWDFLDAALLQTINILQPILRLAAHEKLKDYIFVAAVRPSKKKSAEEDNAVVLRVSLIPSESTATRSVQVSSSVSGIGKTRATTGLAFSPSGAWLVATAGHKAYVCSTSRFEAGFTKFVSPQHLTCLAFHPSEDYFATGDATGCIRLWYCLNENIPLKVVGVEKTAQTTTLHWHSHAVSSIAFTTNGAYLLSGGEEGVLVIWQLHSAKKEYVPRVGAPIVHIALSISRSGEEEYLLGLADASFAFVRSGTLEVSRSIARIKLDPSISHERSSTSAATPLAVHSLNSTLVLPSSHPSSLQTFSLSTSKLISELEVSPSNRVSRRDETPLEPSRVERAVICDSGEWMVTIDSREADETFHGEVYMKVWRWDRKTDAWILNTRVDRPHGLRKVTGLAFSPGAKTKERLLFVTTGEDQNIKTWRIRATKTKTGDTEEFWVTRSTFRFRSETPTDVSWSPDSSLFAVSLGPHVALYDSSSNALHAVLTCPECKQVTSARFLDAGGRYVAAMGDRDLMLWDLVQQKLQWQYHSPVSLDHLVLHPTENKLAVFEQSTTASTKVLVFHPSSSVPSARHTLPFRLRCVVSHPSLSSASTDPSSFTLLGISNTWAVVLFGDEIHLPEEEGSTAQGISAQSTANQRTLFHDIFGKTAFADLTLETTTSSMSLDRAQPWRGKEIKDAFNAPAYLMPPLDTLFDPLMDEFLTRRSADVAAADHEEHEQPEADVDMDVEGEDDGSPFLAGNRIDRVVDQEEMDALVELFKQHAIKTKKSRPNGMHPHSAGSPVPANPNGVMHKSHTATPAHPDPVSADTLTPVATNKKRKKSLG
ncbi:WD40 repeat-like protein [Sparassis latifolia]